MMRLGAPASLLEYKEKRFVITYYPDQVSRYNYVKDLRQYNTKTLLNVTDRHYSPDLFTSYGIHVENLPYPDGTFPDQEIISKWLEFADWHFRNYPTGALAVHDETGLGRSAVLVAIALMESGMQNKEAIDFVRLHRRGAFNEVQLLELTSYMPRQLLGEEQENTSLLGSLVLIDFVAEADKAEAAEAAKKAEEAEATKKGKTGATKKGKKGKAAKKAEEADATKRAKEADATKKAEEADATKRAEEAEAARMVEEGEVTWNAGKAADAVEAEAAKLVEEGEVTCNAEAAEDAEEATTSSV